MNIVDPCIDPRRLPDGSRAVVIAEHQDEYEDLPSIRTPRGQVITRWQPPDSERRAIAAGADVYVTLISRGAINPLLVTIGDQDFKAMEDSLAVERQASMEELIEWFRGASSDQRKAIFERLTPEQIVRLIGLGWRSSK